MSTVRRKIGTPANELVYDWRRPVQGHARELPRAVISEELQEAADEAGDWAEQAWRESSGRGALPEAHGCYEQPGDPPRFTRAFVWRLLLAALAVVALCWVGALWPK